MSQPHNQTLGVPVVATLYHCGESWPANGRLHNGFFLPEDPGDLLCPFCNKATASYTVEDAPLPPAELEPLARRMGRSGPRTMFSNPATYGVENFRSDDDND